MKFGELREKFEGFHDDRGVFCNTYDMLMEAIDVMSEVENNLIWVAFNKEYHKEHSFLQEIADRF